MSSLWPCASLFSSEWIAGWFVFIRIESLHRRDFYRQRTKSGISNSIVDFPIFLLAGLGHVPYLLGVSMSSSMNGSNMIILSQDICENQRDHEILEY